MQRPVGLMRGRASEVADRRADTGRFVPLPCLMLKRVAQWSHPYSYSPSIQAPCTFGLARAGLNESWRRAWTRNIQAMGLARLPCLHQISALAFMSYWH